jgi:hypothetical protein
MLYTNANFLARMFGSLFPLGREARENLRKSIASWCERRERRVRELRRRTNYRRQNCVRGPEVMEVRALLSGTYIYAGSGAWNSSNPNDWTLNGQPAVYSNGADVKNSYQDWRVGPAIKVF